MCLMSSLHLIYFTIRKAPANVRHSILRYSHPFYIRIPNTHAISVTRRVTHEVTPLHLYPITRTECSGAKENNNQKKLRINKLNKINIANNTESPYVFVSFADSNTVEKQMFAIRK